MKTTSKLLAQALIMFFVIIFQGCKKDAETTPDKIPTLSTVPAYEITAFSVITGGILSGNGGSAVTTGGVCWSTASGPTLADNKTVSQAGTGAFESIITGLDANTTYYVRAYATNSVGTAYGNEISFTTTQGTSLRIPNFPGGPRYNAASFSVGSKAYVGMGLNDNNEKVTDFWEWDKPTNVWTRKADFPGNLNGDFLSFSIGNKGYVEAGNDLNGYVMMPNEFWEYDPATDTWVKKASIPVTIGRSDAVGFSIGTKGYIGIGSRWDDNNDSYNDFWEWDQATNVWTKKADFAGNVRQDAVGFSIGTKGYIGTGSDGANYSNEFWEWDQETNVWTKKADFEGDVRSDAIGYSIGNKGYIGTGVGADINHTRYKDVWEWDQASNTWTRKADFTGDPRSEAAAVLVDDRAYIGTGLGEDDPYAFLDFWEYIATTK